MQATDNLSRVHAQHAATNLYGFTCDECHARTVANDCTTGINGAAGFDNHVNGIKSVYFGTTLRATNIDQSGGIYDNAAGNYRCYNIYCHSNGLDNVNFALPSNWPVDNSVSWDNIPNAGCSSCHGGFTGTRIATVAHDSHVDYTREAGAKEVFRVAPEPRCRSLSRCRRGLGASLPSLM